MDKYIIEKLDMDEFKAIEDLRNVGTIYRTTDSRELQIQTLAEKINEIIDKKPTISGRKAKLTLDDGTEYSVVVE